MRGGKNEHHRHLSGRRWLDLLSQAANAVVLLVGLLVLVGWILDIPALQAVVPGLATMKPNTAVAFFLAGMALWLFQPRCWLTATIFGTDAGGVTAWPWLVASIGIPFLLGWLGLAGLKAGFYDSVFGIALVTVGAMVALAVAVLWAMGRPRDDHR